MRKLYALLIGYYIVFIGRYIRVAILNLMPTVSFKLFTKGNGALLTKYITQGKDCPLLVKESNWLSRHRFRILRDTWPRYEREHSEKWKELEELIIRQNILGKPNLCISISKNKIVYKYLEDAETLNEKNFDKKQMQSLLEKIRAVHNKGYVFLDMDINNIIVSKGIIYLIDIDRIDKANSEKEKEDDFDKLLASCWDNDSLFKQMKEILCY